MTPPKNPAPGDAMDGGDAGDEGPPLEVLGGLMRFSFCRLLKSIEGKNKVWPYQNYCVFPLLSCDLPVAEPDANHLLFHVETVGDVGDFFRRGFGVLIEGPLEGDSNCRFDGGAFFTATT